jgi:hypothetical protein
LVASALNFGNWKTVISDGSPTIQEYTSLRYRHPWSGGSACPTEQQSRKQREELSFAPSRGWVLLPHNPALACWATFLSPLRGWAWRIYSQPETNLRSCNTSLQVLVQLNPGLPPGAYRAPPQDFEQSKSNILNVQPVGHRIVTMGVCCPLDP